MKKLLVLFVAFYSYTASAQIQKGKVGIYSGISYQSSNTSSNNETGGPFGVTTESKNTDFIFGIGAFMSDRVFAGVNVGYSNEKIKQVSSSNTGEAFTKSIPVGIVLKWYKALGNRFYYNVNLNAAYESTNREQTSTFGATPPTPTHSSTTKGNTYTGRISPLQITYALSRKFLVEAGFAYIEYRNGNTKTSFSSSPGVSTVDKSNSFNINLSPTVAAFTVTYVF